MYSLHSYVSRRLSFAIAIIMAVWAVAFFFVMMHEVSDEVDESLENYADVLMLRALRGEELPKENLGSTSEYTLREVSSAYAERIPHVRYEDSEVYVRARGEEEPVRVFSQIFRNSEGKWLELQVLTPSIEKEDLMGQIIMWLAGLYFCTFFTIVILNYYGLRRAMRPLHRLLHWLDHYRLGRKNHALNNPTKIMEFRRLNESAVQTLARSENLHEQQRQFLGNASHELQTPLAICQNRIELLLEDESLSEQQLGELLKVCSTLNGLSKLNRSLLLLCKIESGRFADVKHIDWAALLSKLLPDYEELYSAGGMLTEVSVDGSPSWKMDESLAKALLTNLLKNAYVHNAPGGTVRINMNENGISISNTATDGRSLDPNTIFQRFVHRSDSASSTGLGLPIVHAICKHYGLAIHYHFADNAHVFEVNGAI